MPQDYVKYKLYEAVTALATSPAPIQRRLFNAGLILHTSNPEDFTHPGDGQRFAAIIAALVARESRGEEGTLEATTSQLTTQRPSASPSKSSNSTRSVVRSTEPCPMTPTSAPPAKP
jgi:hypothetical protein